jgi:HEXXH motif-containing protein
MTMAPHRMPQDVFAALARGQGGSAAASELAAAQHSKHVILVHGVLAAARPDDAFAARGYELLTLVQRHDPDAAAAVITHPSAGAWAARTLRAAQTSGGEPEHPLPGAKPSGLSTLAAAAAIRAGLPAEIEVPVTGGTVMLPSLGAAVASGDVAVVRTRPAEIHSAGRRVAVQPGAPGWQELRRVKAGSLDVVIDDLDPFRLPAADDLAPRLSPAQAEEFGATLREAWPVLDPQDAAEAAALIRVIVPYRTPLAGHVSSSSPEVFGTVAMSRQPDRYTCAATLVHEVQHVKLSALLDYVTLLGPDDGRLFYAPWREDPRPASGLLQGAYAFLGVSRFWRGRRTTAAEAEVRQRADTEFAKWRAAAAQVTCTLLDSGLLSTAGREFVGAMARVLGAWLAEPVSAAALALAASESSQHLTRWQRANGPLPRAREAAS